MLLAAAPARNTRAGSALASAAATALPPTIAALTTSAENNTAGIVASDRFIGSLLECWNAKRLERRGQVYQAGSADEGLSRPQSPIESRCKGPCPRCVLPGRRILQDVIRE